MTLFEIILAISGGFFAGCINTLSGNGSIVTLGFMTEIMGLPPQIANGTNRLGLLTQGIGSLHAFHHNNRLGTYGFNRHILLGILSAILGALCSIYVDPNSFFIVYKFMMLLMLIMAIFKPDQWYKSNLDRNLQHSWISYVIIIVLGFYGGFIQMGMGVFFVFLMIHFLKTPVLEANIVKIIMVSCYTLIILFLFHHHQMLDWKIGMTIAIGQGIGGWLMAHYASRIPNAAKVAHYLFIIAVSLTVFKLFGLF